MSLLIVDASTHNPGQVYADWLEDLFLGERLDLEPEPQDQQNGRREALHQCAMAKLYPHYEPEGLRYPITEEYKTGFAEAHQWYAENAERFQIKIHNSHIKELK